MPYRPRRHSTARLRSIRSFDAAMRVRNVSGAELARFAQISKQYVSMMRNGQARNVGIPVAEAIERLLAVEHGHLFDFDESGPHAGLDDEIDRADQNIRRSEELGERVRRAGNAP